MIQYPSDQPVSIIAGPCSIDLQNQEEVLTLANMSISGQKILTGCRVVGLKSRTKLDENSWMGLDYQLIKENLGILNRGGNIDDLKQLPSLEIAKQINEQTGLLIASEIMVPGIQMPLMNRALGTNPVLAWNPSVNQLGWQVMEMAQWAEKNSWLIGLKNGKNLGTTFEQAEHPESVVQTSIETVWPGLASYASGAQVVLIHRGVDVPEKGDYRNLAIHQTCLRLKKAHPDWTFYLDPSHIHGPKMKHEITPKTLEAMQLKIDSETYLYEGLLIEVGTAQSDTHQHLSLDEFEQLANGLAEIRQIKGRK